MDYNSTLININQVIFETTTYRYCIIIHCSRCSFLDFRLGSFSYSKHEKIFLKIIFKIEFKETYCPMMYTISFHAYRIIWKVLKVFSSFYIIRMNAHIKHVKLLYCCIQEYLFQKQATAVVILLTNGLSLNELQS